MRLSGDAVELLRCQIGRVVAVAARAGTLLQPVAPAGKVIDGEMVAAAFQAGAYVHTMWELATLRALERYSGFDAAYDGLGAFLDDPSRTTLDLHGPFLLVLFGGAATLRGEPDPCAADIRLPGLVPPDPAIRPEAAPEDPPEPPPPPPRKTAALGRKIGYGLVGGVMAGNVVLLGLNLRRGVRRRPRRPLGPDL